MNNREFIGWLSKELDSNEDVTPHCIKSKIEEIKEDETTVKGVKNIPLIITPVVSTIVGRGLSR